VVSEFVGLRSSVAVSLSSPPKNECMKMTKQFKFSEHMPFMPYTYTM